MVILAGMLKLMSLLMGVGLAGCATAPAPDLVTIGLEATSHCQEVGSVKCTAWSKPELKSGIKNRAAVMGANFVQLSSVTRNRKGYRAEGIAFVCR